MTPTKARLILAAVVGFVAMTAAACVQAVRELERMARDRGE